MKPCSLMVLAATVWLVTALRCVADQLDTPGPADRGAPTRAESTAPAPTKGTPTLGGLFFWTDYLLFHDWRIQRNALTGHYRLLDGKNRRLASGRFERCRETLDQIKRQRRLAPMSGRAVILLHGLGKPRHDMAGMGRYLKKTGRYTALNFTYASTRGSVAEHAAALAQVIGHLEGIDQIDFVAHSLGNLVIRQYFHDQTDDETGRRPDTRIRRIVMLGPPNGGAQLARRFGDNGLFRFFAGASGEGLASKWDELQRQLATPSCEFGIIAGGKIAGSNGNPLIRGDDDLVVRVEETRLPGARDFIVLPVIHTTMMNDTKVQEYTARFLEHGYFVSEDQRNPIASP